MDKVNKIDLAINGKSYQAELPLKEILTRNYQTNNPNIVIAIVSIPVVDIDTIIRVGIANISDIRTNVY